MKIKELIEALTAEQEKEAYKAGRNLDDAVDFIATLPDEEREAGIDKLLDREDEIICDLWAEMGDSQAYNKEIIELMLKDLKAYILESVEDAADDVEEE